MSKNFPKNLKPEALYGLSGSIVKSIAPHTEADPVALLTQLLAAFGSAIGRSPHFVAEADRHGGNINILNVGNTSKGRKGSSWGYIEKLLSMAEPRWKENNIKSGLASGEGLLWAIRDGNGFDVTDQKYDEGVADKRLLCVESEFASVLRVLNREGNTLSPILRNAWDGKKLHTLTKQSPIKVTDPHISIIGHITKQELITLLSQTEVTNGLGNRFMFFSVERKNILPEGGSIHADNLQLMATELNASIQFSQKIGEMKRDIQAKVLWAEVYPRLSEGKYGVAGFLLARSEAQVMRLALLIALINRKTEIDLDCLKAALAIHDYSAKSIHYIFGKQLGNPMADKVLEHLEISPNGLSRTDIRNIFQRNYAKGSIDSSLEMLNEANLAFCKYQKNIGSRPTELWFSTKYVDKIYDENDKSTPNVVNVVELEGI